MKRALFFAMEQDTLTAFLVEKNGTSCTVKESFPVSAPGGSPSCPALPPDTNGEVYLGIPLRLLNCRFLEFPFSDREHIREILPFELDTLVLGGAAGVVFDIFSIRESNGQYRVGVAYASKESLRPLVEAIRTCGIQPKAILSLDLSSFLSSSGGEEDLARLLLDPVPLTEEERLRAAAREMETPAINLARDEFACTIPADRLKKTLRLTAVLSILLLSAYLAFMTFTITVTKREIASVKADIRKTYAALFPRDTKVSSELYQAKAHLKELREKEEYLVGIAPLSLLLDLSAVSRQGVAFQEITMDRERIVLKGECPSLSDVQLLKADLEKRLRGVRISDTKTLAQDRTAFTLSALGKKQ
ncbi:MAG: hypothetical protein K8I29_00185 [Alphaproteobacteria bacterium]|uniref:GspL periplasmic domain-containing protein n=1 Tax=Candidatus Nitrobium versatile TaxID=2884831 RepID=A0A953J1N0_9BACT|nr:hypothetical protein [Candidatus Nitrobium versatile]